jgi:predicted nucleic acid-binding protein
MPGSRGRSGRRLCFAGRILSFDDKAGLVWARLMAEGKAAGRPRSGLDMIIAAVAGSNDCVVSRITKEISSGSRSSIRCTKARYEQHQIHRHALP